MMLRNQFHKVFNHQHISSNQIFKLFKPLSMQFSVKILTILLINFFLFIQFLKFDKPGFQDVVEQTP